MVKGGAGISGPEFGRNVHTYRISEHLMHFFRIKKEKKNNNNGGNVCMYVLRAGGFFEFYCMYVVMYIHIHIHN